MITGDIDLAVQALADGRVVGVPTDTVYGLAVDPRQPDAVARLFAVKKRPEQFALPVLIAEASELGELAEVSPAAERLVARHWPGPLTLVLVRRSDLSYELGGDSCSIGVRCPANDLVRELLKRTGPLAVTSANLHGLAPLQTAEELDEHFGHRLGVVLDGGRLQASASTVISLTGPAPECLRRGVLDFAELKALAAGG
jgi:tRNA threonylcarbamoyl adenosine modification protein (Sua5/YciO/YrdC/YwlC family)